MLSASYAEEMRRLYGPPEIGVADPADLERISKDSTVKHGPFKGLKYPSANSVGSVMLPKLLGSYEKELHPVIEEVCGLPYSKIIDVGCAEGYYAIGFAMRNPGAHVYAYDTEKFAREFCRTLAETNNVSERVTIEGFCSGETLKGLSDGGRNLIFCDCESYEKQLFTEDLVPYLATSDLIIELHDLDDIEISTYISNLFKETHEQIFIQSIDDIQKAKTYRYEELEGLDLANRKRILAENRLTIMEWVFLKSKTAQA
jgi:predicted O-methyltransferase YrrM